MRYTEEQRDQFKNRFFQKRLYQFALIIPVGGALYMLSFGGRYAAELGMEPLMVALGTGGLILAAALFHWLNWRCPACGKHLGNVLNPARCSKCGVALRSP
jgi:hypothetical protein